MKQLLLLSGNFLQKNKKVFIFVYLLFFLFFIAIFVLEKFYLSPQNQKIDAENKYAIFIKNYNHNHNFIKHDIELSKISFSTNTKKNKKQNLEIYKNNFYFIEHISFIKKSGVVVNTTQNKKLNLSSFIKNNKTKDYISFIKDNNLYSLYTVFAKNKTNKTNGFILLQYQNSLVNNMMLTNHTFTEIFEKQYSLNLIERKNILDIIKKNVSYKQITSNVLKIPIYNKEFIFYYYKLIGTDFYLLIPSQKYLFYNFFTFYILCIYICFSFFSFFFYFINKWIVSIFVHRGGTDIDGSVVKNEIIKNTALNDTLNLEKNNLGTDTLTMEDTEILNKLRERTFNNETLQLIQDIKININEPDTLAESIKQFQDKNNLILLPSIFKDLDAGYAKEDASISIEITEVLEYLATSIKVDAAYLLNYSSTLGCYEPVSTYNVSYPADRNLYLLHHDPYIKISKHIDVIQEMTESLKTNPYIIKRFSAELLEQIKFIRYVPLHSHNIDTFLIFLYFNDISNEQYLISDDEQALILGDVLPMIKLFLSQDTFQDINDITVASFFNTLKGITHGGLDKATIVHFYPVKVIDNIMFDTIKNKLKDVLIFKERLFYISPTHLIFILIKTDVNLILETLFTMVGEYKNNVYIFPDDGKMISNYF